MSMKATGNSANPGLRIWKGIRSFCYGKRWYFLVFFLPVVIMTLAYAFFKVYPFGKNSVLVLDLNGQYVYYYEAFRDAFWGKGSFIYNWSRNLSGEMFGIFAYYLASPFMLIPVLLPRKIMMFSVAIMQLAKMGTAAVTFRFFLNKLSKGKGKKLSLVIFPLMYSIMGYMVVQLMDPMWLDGLILLPLICWGVHRLVNEGKLISYIIPIAMMFITHFYIGYMVGIFTFFYFCYVCLSNKDRKLPKKFFSACVSFAVSTLLALMCAAFVLIPVYNSLKLGKFDFTEPDFTLKSQFDFLNLITKMFPMTYDTIKPEGTPVVYCGVCALLLLPLFFMNEKIHIKEKTGLGILASLIALLMYIKPADMAMHGFQVPNWLPFRYSFIFSFLVLVMAFKAFENLDGITAKNIGGVFFGLLIFLFWCEREQPEFFKTYIEKEADGEKSVVIQGIWVSIIAVSIYFALIYLQRKYSRSKILCIVTTVLISCELFVNAADTVNKINDDVIYSKYESYEPYMSELRAAVDMMKDYDSEPFYRMEANFHRTVNDAIGTGYMGLSHSSSTMNAPILSALQKLGFAYGGHYTKYKGATPMTDAVFGVKYLMNKTGDTSNIDKSIVIPEEYKLKTEYKAGKNNFEFYENPNALGLGVLAKGDISGVELNDKNPFISQNRLFKAVTGEKKNYFTKAEIVRTYDENLASTELECGDKKYYQLDTSDAEVHKDYVVKINRDSHLYMFLPATYKKSCNIWVKDEEKYLDGETEMDYAGKFFEGDNYSILNLGKFVKDQEVRIRVTIANEDKYAYWSDALFYTFDYENFTKKCSELKSSSFNVTEFDTTYLKGTIKADGKGQTLFTTIPYENGWQIKVNGKTVTPGKCIDSLITIPLEEGENVITMKFSPNYFKLSVVISLVGLFVTVFIFLVEYKKGKYFKKLIGRMSAGAENKSGREDKSDKKEEITPNDEKNIAVIKENLNSITRTQEENDEKNQ